METTYLLRQNEAGDMGLYAIKKELDWGKYFRYWGDSVEKMASYFPDFRRNLEMVEFDPYCGHMELWLWVTRKTEYYDNLFLKNGYLKFNISPVETIYMPIGEARRIIKEYNFTDLQINTNFEDDWWIDQKEQTENEKL